MRLFQNGGVYRAYLPRLAMLSQDCVTFETRVRSFLDDLVVHGKTQQEHDERLESLLQVLEVKGLTLNLEKCQFSKARILFMGHLIQRGYNSSR